MMDNLPPYSILMFVFSVMILFYALITYITKSVNMLSMRGRYAAKMKDEKKYMEQFAKALAIFGIVPALSGLTAILNGWLAGVVFVAGGAVALWLGTKVMKSAM